MAYRDQPQTVSLQRYAETHLQVQCALSLEKGTHAQLGTSADRLKIPPPDHDCRITFPNSGASVSTYGHCGQTRNIAFSHVPLARFLIPLVKARDFGMTPMKRESLINSSALIAGGFS
jgi:hypothetical protein